MKLMLNNVVEALKNVTDVVVYGTIMPKDIENNRWEFIVVQRADLIKSNGAWYQEIAINYADEDYVKEGIEFEIIDEMKKLNLIYEASKGVSYNSFNKSSSQDKVEMITLYFKIKVRSIC